MIVSVLCLLYNGYFYVLLNHDSQLEEYDDVDDEWVKQHNIDTIIDHADWTL